MENLSKLKELQSMTLDEKIDCTKEQIRIWKEVWGTDKVYISYSGGKDSTVMLDICDRYFPNEIPVVYVDTGLELPSVKELALKRADRVLKPQMTISEVIKRYGYSLISKEVSGVIKGAKRNNKSSLKSIDGSRANEYGGRYDYSKWAFLVDAPFLISDDCCRKLKKECIHRYESESGRHPIVATMAAESQLRASKWVMKGSNDFESKRPVSKPISIWTEQDIYTYIKRNNLPIASIYGKVVEKDSLETQLSLWDLCASLDESICNEENCQYRLTGCTRTGCAMCLYGVHLEKRPNRFEILDKHGLSYIRDYCMRGGYFNENGLWEPDEQGLGYWFVLGYLNKFLKKKVFVPDYDNYRRTYGERRTDYYLKDNIERTLINK